MRIEQFFVHQFTGKIIAAGAVGDLFFLVTAISYLAAPLAFTGLVLLFGGTAPTAFFKGRAGPTENTTGGKLFAPLYHPFNSL